MRSKVLSVIFLLVTVGTTFLLNSCTLINTGCAVAENYNAPYKDVTVSRSGLEKAKTGSKIIVNLKDSTIVSGKYLGIDSIPNEKYAEKYAELQRQMPEGSFLPPTGDTITASSKISTQSNLRFYGFDNENILLSPIESDNAKKLKLEFLENIKDKRGNIIKGETIRKLIYENEIPPLFLSRISIEEHTQWKDAWGVELDSIDKKLIYMNNIDQIQIKATKLHALGCFALGLVADAAIVGLFFIALAMAIGSA